VGRLINRTVAEAAVRRFKLADGRYPEAAVKMFCSKSHPGHAYDRIEQALPISADEWMMLGGISERIAKALVDQLMKKENDRATAQHPPASARRWPNRRSTELRDFDPPDNARESSAATASSGPQDCRVGW